MDPRPPSHAHRRPNRWLIPAAIGVVVAALIAGMVGSILAAAGGNGAESDVSGVGEKTEQRDDAGEQACRQLVNASDAGVLGVATRNAASPLSDHDWALWIQDVRSIGRAASRSSTAAIATIGEDIDGATAGETASPRDLIVMTLELANACETAGYVTNAQIGAAAGEPPDDEADERGDKAAEEPDEADITTGIWTVGVDVDPGTYRTTGVASDDCYWAVLVSGTNGEDIVANYIGGGRPVVVLQDGHDFETDRCGGWAKVDIDQLHADADPADTIEAGIWTIGVDVAPGTYRPGEPAGEDCYWAVLESGTNGEEIINNGLGGGRPTVTLAVGQDFETDRCGTWELG